MLDISPYPTLIQLEYFLGGIHHCVTVVGECIFESNIPFALPLKKYNVGYCCVDDHKTKGINDQNIFLKAIRFFTKGNNKSVIQK